MEVLAWIRFILGAILIILGLLIFVVEMIGVFRFKYVLNRMHSAAMGDTLGITAVLVGLILISGWNFTTLKFILIIVYFWFASPTSSHLIANFEIVTDEDDELGYEVKELKDIEDGGNAHE